MLSRSALRARRMPPTTRSWRRRRRAAAGTRPRAPCRPRCRTRRFPATCRSPTCPAPAAPSGLAQFVNEAKGDPTSLIVGGYVMVGAILTNDSPVTLDQITPIARLTGEYEAIVVPAASDIQDMADLVAKLKADPGAVSWAGGSAGGTDHITAGLIAKAVGVDPDQDQLHRLLRRRRSAGGHPRRPGHGRHFRLWRVRRAGRRPARCACSAFPAPSGSPASTRRPSRKAASTS